MCVGLSVLTIIAGLFCDSCVSYRVLPIQIVASKNHENHSNCLILRKLLFDFRVIGFTIEQGEVRP